MVEDAENIAWLALLEACREFRPDAGVHFSAFAVSKIKFGLWNAGRKQHRFQSREIGGMEMDWRQSSDNPAAEVETRMMAERALQELAKLPELQRYVLDRIYLHGDTLSDVAEVIGVTPQAIYRTRNRGLANLRKAM